MSSSEIIQQSFQPVKMQENINDVKLNYQLLEEVRNLKKMVSALTERESLLSKKEIFERSTQKQGSNVSNPQSQALQSKSRRNRQEQAQVKKNEDIYKNLKNDWKIRITNRNRISSHIRKNDLDESKKIEENKSNFFSENQDKANLDESIINKHLSFLNSRTDTDQQQPARTQFYVPNIKKNKQASQNQFHFKKMNCIPVIENDHNRFRSYISSQRKNCIANRHAERQSVSKQQIIKISASHSDFSKKKVDKYVQSKEGKLVQSIRNINITRQTQRDELIKKGKMLLKVFNCSFNQQIITIKKYKNCLVFSLLPNITKAIIFYFSGDIYFGQVSLDESGRIEKNGVGIQIIKERHYYEGHFINGKKNGRGKIIYQNGDCYDGQWSQGEIYGQGKYTQRKDDRIFEGFWKKGDFCGQNH